MRCRKARSSGICPDQLSAKRAVAGWFVSTATPTSGANNATTPSQIGGGFSHRSAHSARAPAAGTSTATNPTAVPIHLRRGNRGELLERGARRTFLQTPVDHLG